MKIFFLPLNYESADDSDFLERVEIYKNFSIEYTPLKESDFEIIDKPVIFSQWSVGQAEGLKTILRICNLEFKKKYGYKLPQKFTYENEQMFGSFSVHRYFVVALDKIVPSVPPDACGSATCAFTSSIYPIMYISAHECGRAPHAIVHEMGHHAGLCDEYKKCRWDVQNESRLGNRGVGCLNSRPDPTNSDCVSDECPKCGGVCLGKYADTKESGYFNIMGSAGIPPPRRLSSESKEIIYTYLCNYLGVCDNE